MLRRRSIALGLVVILGFYCFEIIYYCRATDFGINDNVALVWQYFHPQCEAGTAGALDFTCPLPGYNSMRMECWSSVCDLRDWSSPPMTRDRQMARIEESNADRLASRKAEPDLTPKQLVKLRSDLAKIREHRDEDLEKPPEDINLSPAYVVMKRRAEFRLFAAQVNQKP